MNRIVDIDFTEELSVEIAAVTPPEAGTCRVEEICRGFWTKWRRLVGE